MTLDLAKYGITDVKEVVHNPSYEQLHKDETAEGLVGYEKGVVTELGAINVMTGIYTGRSPKDKFFVVDDVSKDTVWWTSEEYKMISLKYANGLRNGANSDTHRCKQLTEHGEERCIKLREVAGFSAVRTIFQIVGPRKILHCLLGK